MKTNKDVSSYNHDSAMATRPIHHKASRYHFEDLSQFVASAVPRLAENENDRRTVEEMAASVGALERLNSSATDYDDEMMFNFGKYIRMRSADDTGKLLAFFLII